MSGALEIRGGIETGVNTNPVFRFKNTNFQGTDGIFRGVPGATVYLNFFDPRVLGLKFKKISVLSSYDVRLLTKDEIFLETRTSSPDPDPSTPAATTEQSGNRHSVQIYRCSWVHDQTRARKPAAGLRVRAK